MRELWARVYTATEAILDVILPLRKRAARTKQRTIEDIPLTPTTHKLLGATITTLMDFREPAVTDMIKSLKYDHSHHAANLAALSLADYLREEIASHKLFSTRRILLVPVPLHPSRQRERGFNQIEKVLRALPADFRDSTIATLTPNILTRTRATQSQTHLHRRDRLANVANAFAASQDIPLQHTHIFLLDDVTTTGATLLHAGKPLQSAGATVSLLALARA